MTNPLTNPADLSFRELQSAVKEKGLNAAGTREELESRLAEATPQEGPAPTVPTVSKSAEEVHRDAALKQKAYNDAQPKVAVFIPFNEGENPEQAKQIPFVVNINGWRTEVPRGVMAEVPKNIFDIISERLTSEGRMGQNIRIDSDQRKLDALS